MPPVCATPTTAFRASALWRGPIRSQALTSLCPMEYSVKMDVFVSKKETVNRLERLTCLCLVLGGSVSSQSVSPVKATVRPPTADRRPPTGHQRRRGALGETYPRAPGNRNPRAISIIDSTRFKTPCVSIRPASLLLLLPSNRAKPTPFFLFPAR